MNSKKTKLIPCDHGVLVVMSWLASGAEGEKFQHAITNSCDSLIIVIQGKLIAGDTLIKTGLWNHSNQLRERRM